MRREKYVKVGFQWLRQMLTGSHHPVALPVTSDAPADLRVVWVDAHPDHYARVYVTSETFPELADDEAPPELIVTMTAHAPGT
jgi:hypothetical protein